MADGVITSKPEPEAIPGFTQELEAHGEIASTLYCNNEVFTVVMSTDNHYVMAELIAVLVSHGFMSDSVVEALEKAAAEMNDA